MVVPAVPAVCAAPAAHADVLEAPRSSRAREAGLAEDRMVPLLVTPSTNVQPQERHDFHLSPAIVPHQHSITRTAVCQPLHGN